MPKKKEPIYSIRDFENEKDTLQRLRMCLIEPNFFQYLTDREMQKFDKLYQVFASVHSARNMLVPPEHVVKNIVPGTSADKAKKLLAETYEVFEFGESKDIRKQLATQMQWKLAEKAYNAAITTQDYDYASKILERATMLDGLHKIKDETERPRRVLPKRIILSSNPEVLINQQERQDGHSNSDTE